MGQRGIFRAVADRTGFSREEAADITRAVLEGLGDQLSDGEARRLAADLPELAGQVTVRRRRRTEAHPVRLIEFVRRVSRRTGMTEDDARAGAAAVLAVLRDELGRDGYRHLTGQLPTAYTDLVEPAVLVVPAQLLWSAQPAHTSQDQVLADRGGRRGAPLAGRDEAGRDQLEPGEQVLDFGPGAPDPW